MSTQILENFIAHQKLKVSKTAISLASLHPEYPSFIGFSAILDSWKIPNMAVKITEKELSQIPYPAFAHIQSNESFVLLTGFDNDKISYYNEKNVIVEEKLSIFSEKWSGKMLLAEPNENSGETTYKESKQKENLQKIENYILGSIICILLIFSVITASSAVELGVFLSVIFGLTASVFLLINEFGTLPALVARMCHIGAETSCNAVTKSAQAKLLGWLSWSEIGFLYFFSNFLALFWCFSTQKTTEIIPILFIIATLTLPYTVFSVYYQAFVVKKWCTLCMIVLVSLWLYAGILWVDFKGFQHTSLLGANVLIFSFLFPVLIWFLFKSFIIKAKKQEETEKNLQVYERNTDIFESFLASQETILITPFSKEIISGDVNAKTTILSVCSPFCKPCALSHKEIENLSLYFGEVKLITRFVVNNDLDSQANTVIKHILSLPSELLNVAVDDWFSLMDYEKFSEKYPIIISNEAATLLIEHAKWSNSLNINYTPTIFINGKELKYPYDSRKLKYHFRNIIAS